MSTITQAQVAAVSAAVVAAGPRRSAWLVSPAFDLLFLACGMWPFIALLVLLGNPRVDWSLSFWQVYFLSTPHRWITLPLVFLDGERFWQRPGSYVGVALLVAVLMAAAWASTGTLALLLAVDYLWNAWHFAAQHSGISRIYGRHARPDVKSTGLFEKIVLRLFILYTLFRLLGFPNIDGEDVSPWLDWLRAPVQSLQGLDLYVLALPVFLLLAELRDFRPTALGRCAYLGSVCSLYGLILLGTHFHSDGRWMSGLFLAVSMFHATEYLAIVSWSVWKKHGRAPASLFGRLVPRWCLALVLFASALALGGFLMDHFYFRTWLVVTIFVSYLHYAYDGMIWKVRRPASAAVA